MTVDIGMPGMLPPREERDPIVISNSSIQSWKDCRRRFWLSYMRRLRPRQEKMSGALALGSRVHKALELYYIEIMKGETGSRELMEEVWKTLVSEDRLALEAEGRDTSDFDNEAELGRIMLEGYVDWLEDEGIDSRYKIVGLEDTLEHLMLDGQVLLVGKLDQRVRDTRDNTMYVRDHKTSANFTDLEKTIEMNEQFLLYQTLEMLTKENPDDRVSGTIVTGLKKVKRTASARGPFYTQLEISHNIFTLRNFYKHLHGVLLEIVNAWRDIEDGADPHLVMYPHPTRDCSWKCPFAAGCSMFDNGGAVEQWLEEHFEPRSPYEYYGSSDPLAKLEDMKES